MNATDLLAHVRVASPCLARWADMTGDDRARFCGQCRKHVYNLSEMTAAQAADLIREKEGNLCVRFFQRGDGTVLTANCPVGAARLRQRNRRFALATALGLFFGASVVTLAGAAGEGGNSPGSSRLARVWNNAVWKVKGWLGIQPPRIVMGGMCAPPRPNAPPPPVASK